MNKNSLILRPRQKLSLGDLILAVSSCTKSSRETGRHCRRPASAAVRCESKITAGFCARKSANFGKVIFERSGGFATGAFSFCNKRFPAFGSAFMLPG
jgi:hypothetical protein